MKNKKLLRIPILLLLFIPFYMAVYNMWLIASDTLTSDNVTKVIVTGANDTEYEYTDKNDIKLYIQIIENVVEVAEPLRDLELEEAFTVSFYKGQVQTDYLLYLSQNTDDCLMRFSDGTLNLLRKSDAEKLFATPIADSLYKYNNVPVIKVIFDEGVDVTDVYPSSGEWYLKKADNMFLPSNVQNIFKATNSIKAARGKFLEFEFPADPDSLNIVIYKDNEIIFNGPHESFYEFIYDSNSNLKYVLSAEWHEKDYAEYYGTAEYTLNVEYSVPPDFEISKSSEDSVVPGEIVVVTAVNMRDTDTPTITTNMGDTINFTKVNDNHIALLPISIDSMGKAFNIELSGSSVAENKSYTINVDQQTYDSANFSAQDAMFQAHKSASALENKLKSYDTIFASKSTQKIYWAADPKFIIPHEGEILLKYGWNLTINMGAHTQNKGVNIAAAKGTPIAAANSGTVVFAGTVPDDGNLLVIDHGGGVRSWYGHLDTINVAVGNEVAKGQEVAVSGTSGMYSSLESSRGANLYFAISVHTVFVNPLSVIENGILPD